jgi:hypothetical protein
MSTGGQRCHGRSVSGERFADRDAGVWIIDASDAVNSGTSRPSGPLSAASLAAFNPGGKAVNATGAADRPGPDRGPPGRRARQPGPGRAPSLTGTS